MLGADLGSDGLSLQRSFETENVSVRAASTLQVRSETHLLSGHGLLAGLGQLGDSPRVLPQVDLATDEDDRQTRAEVEDLGNPLY